MNTFLMDAHMHFDLYKNRDDVLNYIERNHSYTIAMTNLPELYEKYYKEYSDYKYIRMALGFHPELVYQYKNQMITFLKYIETTRYIGEIGLDFTVRDNNNRMTQKEIFADIVRACQSATNKILSIHTRKAEKECIEILDSYSGKVIFHWYSGSLDLLKIAIEKSYYFSINQQMLLNKSGRDIINSIPIERILIESDAPFSVGLEDEYNLFFNQKVYDYLSETKNISQEDVKGMIMNNFKAILS